MSDFDQEHADAQARRDAHKAEAMSVINRALSAARAANGNAPLTRWQRHFLCQALGNVCNGVFGLALHSANLALQPKGTYNDATLPDDSELKHFEIDDLQQIAAQIETWPAPLRPIFIAPRRQ